MDGTSGTGLVQFIAMVSSPDGVTYKEVSVACDVLSARNGDEVKFGPRIPSSPLGLLCSANAKGAASAAAATP